MLCESLIYSVALVAFLWDLNVLGIKLSDSVKLNHPVIRF